MGEMKTAYTESENLNTRHDLETLGTDGRIILKWVVKN
jgi:hypothetical protein